MNVIYEFYFHSTNSNLLSGHFFHCMCKKKEFCFIRSDKINLNELLQNSLTILLLGVIIWFNLWEDPYNSLTCKLRIFHTNETNVILTHYGWDSLYLFLLKLSRDAFIYFITFKELNGSSKRQRSLLSRQIKRIY